METEVPILRPMFDTTEAADQWCAGVRITQLQERMAYFESMERMRRGLVGVPLAMAIWDEV
jgi:hypothetical protein